VIFSRIHEPKTWSDSLAPVSDRTLLCTEVFCDFNDELWRMSDSDLLEATIAGLKNVGIIQTAEEVEDICIKRLHHAYPLLYAGYEEPLGSVKNRLAAFNNIYLAGRSGAHTYYDMEECLEDIRSTTEKVKQELSS